MNSDNNNTNTENTENTENIDNINTLPPIVQTLNLPPSIITEINEANGNIQTTPPIINNFTFGDIPLNPHTFIFNGASNNAPASASASTSSSNSNAYSNPFNFNFPAPIQIPNLDSFSPEEIEEEIFEDNLLDTPEDSDDSEETEDTEENDNIVNNTNTSSRIIPNTRRLFRLRQFKNLPHEHFSIGVTWSFENNYDYYKLEQVRYFSQCRSTRYLSFKNQVNELNNYKNIKIGKYWEIKIPKNNINVKYMYFIIYFNNTLGYIDIDYYGLFSEEINEDKTIEQLVELGIYGTTGRLHKPDMTCTDGVGFNLLKKNIN